MILIIKIKEGWPCVLPKKILSEGKTYNFKEDLPDDEVFQDRFFGMWERASKNAKPNSLRALAKPICPVRAQDRQTRAECCTLGQ